MSKRKPQPGEIQQMDTERLLRLYRAACERLRDAGGWRDAPMASAWAGQICTELDARGEFDTVLRIEAECK